MCCWNENPRSFKELLCRLLYGRQQQHSLMYISHFVAITEIEMNGPCAFVSLLLDFLSWWWKGTDEVALVIRQTTDSQLLVGDPPLRWHHFVVVPLFCFVAAWLGLLDFLLLVVQTFFCLWFLFETTELWFQSATLETCSSGVRQKILYPTHNNNIPARPAVGSDKANYYLLKDTQSDPVSPWHHFLLLRPPPPTRCIILITSSGIDGTEAPSQHYFLSIKVNEVDH